MEENSLDQAAPVKQVSVNDTEKKEALQKAFDLVITSLNAGESDAVITAKLVDLGIDPAEAPAFLEAAKNKAADVAIEEEAPPSSYLMGILGGVIGAIIGGILWAWLTKATEKEYGYAALGIGWLCGMGVHLFTGMKKGKALQIIAAATAALGIVLGKYGMFLFYVWDEVVKEQGSQAQVISLVNPALIPIFIENIKDMVSAFDILWIVLAVWVAWAQLTRGLKKTNI